MNKRKIIPYGRQFIDKEDIKVVSSILREDYITCGRWIERFEKDLAKKCGAKYAVAVSSGTAALHIAYKAAGFGEGDEILVPANTFAATANAVFYCGAIPKFIDISLFDYNIDVEKIEEAITSRTKAIVPVHFAGAPCDMEKIYNIAKKYSLIVIEDACHALGAKYRSTPIGSCKYSDMTVFSFHPVKHITTGEGGAITTNSKIFYQRLINLRNHGIKRVPQKARWYYEISCLGYNYRLTDIQAGLGVSQLKKLDKFIKRRREIAELYNYYLKDVKKIKLPLCESSFIFHSYHLYVVLIDFKYYKISRSKLMEELLKRGIGTQVHYIPVYRHPLYKKLGYRIRLRNTEKYYQQTLSLPCFYALTDSQVKYISTNLKDILLK